MSFDICPASDLVTQGFGCTSFTSEWIAGWCPSGHYHSGIDLGMRIGSLYHQPAFATRAGQIVAVGTNGGDWGFWNYLGNQAVCLKTHDAYVLYAHLDVASVVVGQMVQAGQQVGLVGSRGNSTGPHLHVEVRTDGAKQNVWQNAVAVLDPAPYLNYLAGGSAGSEVIVGGLTIADINDIIVKLDQLIGMVSGSPGSGHSSLLWDGEHTPYLKDIRDILSRVPSADQVTSVAQKVDALATKAAGSSDPAAATDLAAIHAILDKHFK